jgi:hypothetical protein
MTPIYIIILFILTVGLFTVRRNKKFKQRTQSIFDNIETIQDKLVLENVFCTFKTFGSLTIRAHNIYIFKNCIILSESVIRLTNQKYYQLIAPTYIITKAIPLKFDFILFNNKMTDFKLNIEDGGNIILKGSMSNQSIISSIGFMNDFEISINIKTGKDKQFLVTELHKYGLC